MEEFMRPLEVSINRLARNIGVPPNRISGIVNGKRSITAGSAIEARVRVRAAWTGSGTKPPRALIMRAA